VFASHADWNCHFTEIGNVHLVTVKPGKIRGNHFHRKSKELLLIKHISSFRLHWMEQDTRRQRSFDGKGAVLVQIDPGCPHAVMNTGTAELTILSLQEHAYDPDSPDLVKVELTAEEDVQPGRGKP
jgi:UDP-2-acetamido-2,6-beta-L-arabino-hexul-4-ose reductase